MSASPTTAAETTVAAVDNSKTIEEMVSRQMRNTATREQAAHTKGTG